MTHDYHMIQKFPGEAIKCEDGGVKVMNTVELLNKSYFPKQTLL